MMRALNTGFPKEQWSEDTINDAFDLLGKQPNNAEGQRNTFKTDILAQSHFALCTDHLTLSLNPFLHSHF